jgi:transposase
LAVERVVLTGLVRIVQLVTDDPDAAGCPGCQVVSTSGKDWVLTRPHDLPSGGGQIAVQWRKRRWRCRTVDCARQTFTEQVGQVPAGMRTTTRLRTALAAVEDGRDQSEVAAAHGVSWPTVQRAVVARGAAELVEPEPVAVLGMDETRGLLRQREQLELHSNIGMHSACSLRPPTAAIHVVGVRATPPESDVAPGP